MVIFAFSIQCHGLSAELSINRFIDACSGEQRVQKTQRIQRVIDADGKIRKILDAYSLIRAYGAK